MYKKRWITEAEWYIKNLKKHIKKILGYLTHITHKEKEEILSASNSLLLQTSKKLQELENPNSSSPKEFVSVLCFCKNLKKEMNQLKRDLHALILDANLEAFSRLIEDSIFNITKIEAEVEEIKHLPYPHFAAKAHDLELLISKETANINHLYLLLQNPHELSLPPQADVEEVILEVTNALLHLNKLELTAKKVLTAYESNSKRARLERLKSHLVQAMVAAHSGHLLIDHSKVYIKSTFNNQDTKIFALHRSMKEALIDFFENEEIINAISELNNKKKHRIVGNFEILFEDEEKQPRQINLSIGKVVHGTETITYQPVRMSLKKEHIQEAMKRISHKPF